MIDTKDDSASNARAVVAADGSLALPPAPGSEDACAPVDLRPSEAVQAELRDKVEAIASRTIFLVHYYQPTWIKRLLAGCEGVELVVADSQELAKRGHDSDHELIFCVTVPFMAGSSAVLARDEQRVVLADHEAGCSLESSAPEPWVRRMLQRLAQLGGAERAPWVPVCYTNVSAEVKAVTGEYGGIIHTSSSAISAYQWAIDQGRKPVFLPDQHLAANIVAERGVERVALWHNDQPDGGVGDAELEAAEMVIWTGECSVHVRAREEEIAAFAIDNPEAWLILHPEVPNASVRAAVSAAGRARVGLGSTLFIRRKLAELAVQQPGATVGVATETNFVTELQQEYSDRLQVHNLLSDVCACVNMRTRPEQMLGALNAVLDDALDGSDHLVQLDPQVKEGANRALARSLELSSAPFDLDWT